MSGHSHGFTNWPFADPENLATFSCVHVMERSHPILRVAHDDDGAWQFLCGQLHDMEDARLVCLGCMVKREPELLTLADLPREWCAERDSPGESWIREPNPADPDEDE
jgi:hypothetical protein